METWQEILRNSIRDPKQLCWDLNIPESSFSPKAASQFPLIVSKFYLSRMEKGNPNDPLLKQILPIEEETQTHPGFSENPVGDAQARTAPGILQKYHGRALLLLSGSCAINCRYCFRKAYPYSEEPWRGNLNLIVEDESINEVILSGGDPLMWSDEKLFPLFQQLESIQHLKRIRIHTRLPLVIPERITTGFCRLLRQSRLTPFIVLHANHPRELGEDLHDPVATALSHLVDSGIPVLNQSVLLKGVNDSLETLIELSNRLLERRVLPYYLHQLDRVIGSQHFEVEIETGRQLIQKMTERLPGFAVPKYVLESPSELSKLRL